MPNRRVTGRKRNRGGSKTRQCRPCRALETSIYIRPWMRWETTPKPLPPQPAFASRGDFPSARVPPAAPRDWDQDCVPMGEGQHPTTARCTGDPAPRVRGPANAPPRAKLKDPPFLRWL